MRKKDYLQQQLKYHREQAVKLEKEIADLPEMLKLSSKDKPFHKWSLAEMNNLADIDEKAFKYFTENNSKNADKTIKDYNQTVPRIERIIVEK